MKPESLRAIAGFAIIIIMILPLIAVGAAICLFQKLVEAEMKQAMERDKYNS